MLVAATLNDIVRCEGNISGAHLEVLVLEDIIMIFFTVSSSTMTRSSSIGHCYRHGFRYKEIGQKSKFLQCHLCGIRMFVRQVRSARRGRGADDSFLLLATNTGSSRDE
jgi:hypothetical protein